MIVNNLRFAMWPAHYYVTVCILPQTVHTACMCYKDALCMWYDTHSLCLKRENLVIPQSSMRKSKLDLCIARMCGRTKQQHSQLALVVLLQLLEQFKK